VGSQPLGLKNEVEIPIDKQVINPAEIVGGEKRMGDLT